MKSFSSIRRLSFAAILSLCFASITSAQLLSLQRVASGLSAPIFVTFAPGDSDHLFVLERNGAIKMLNLHNIKIEPTTFVTIPGVSTISEGGALGLAFHPDYQTNGFFYVHYTTDEGGPFRSRIGRFTRTSSTSADPKSLHIVLEVDQPQPNQNGGWIGFGPSDQYLYIAFGDGGAAYDSGAGHTERIGNAQDITDNFLGKLLRIDVDEDSFPADPVRNYSSPASNPYVGKDGDDEIFLYGLRNPFRCSFDRSTGDLYIGDVGQGDREEINFYPASGIKNRNLGWRLREGTLQTPNVGGPQPIDGLNPIYDYLRVGQFGGTSVTGGVVYRGPITALSGFYLFADYGSNNIWGLQFDGSSPSEFDGANHNGILRWNEFLSVDQGVLSNIVAFGEDAIGNVYLCDFSGEVFRIVAGEVAPHSEPQDIYLNFGSVPPVEIRVDELYRGNGDCFDFFNADPAGTMPAVSLDVSRQEAITGLVRRIFSDSGIANVQVRMDGGPTSNSKIVFFAEEPGGLELKNGDTFGGKAYLGAPNRTNATPYGEAIIVCGPGDSDFVLAAKTAHEIGHLLGLLHVNPTVEQGDVGNLEVMDYENFPNEQFINAVSDEINPPDETGTPTGVTHNTWYHLKRYLDGVEPEVLKAIGSECGTWDDPQVAINRQVVKIESVAPDVTIYNVLGVAGGEVYDKRVVGSFQMVTIQQLNTFQFEINEGETFMIIAASQPTGPRDIVLSNGDRFDPISYQLSPGENLLKNAEWIRFFDGLGPGNVEVLGNADVSSILKTGPSAIDIEIGQSSSGAIGSTFVSDDSSLVLQAEVPAKANGTGVGIVFDTIISNKTPSSLLLQLESRGNSPNIFKSISIFNQSTGTYEQIFQGIESTTDSIDEIELPKPYESYIEAKSSTARFKVEWKAIGPVTHFPWSSALDLVELVISP